MRNLPDKLFQMIEDGVPEDYIHAIFDYLLEAENASKRFVNVYDGETSKPVFFSTTDRAKADDQLKRAKGIYKQSFGLELVAATWNER